MHQAQVQLISMGKHHHQILRMSILGMILEPLLLLNASLVPYLGMLLCMHMRQQDSPSCLGSSIQVLGSLELVLVMMLAHLCGLKFTTQADT
ncbi:hypothetical protein HHK36_023039 [Tetracentron sinense]|uniref:Uncharacterized protein n=1 Tax=Tetracentron sinense TaxID=13715 RepID=A0A834YR44_TETSI|nr:hypothetical protein HHK36_023039 [Tetracentron sinense]